MNYFILGGAIAILCLCIFNNIVAVVLGLSPFVLIGVVAALMGGGMLVGPLRSTLRDGGARYENRLVRRPGV